MFTWVLLLETYTGFHLQGGGTPPLSASLFLCLALLLSRSPTRAHTIRSAFTVRGAVQDALWPLPTYECNGERNCVREWKRVSGYREDHRNRGTWRGRLCFWQVNGEWGFKIPNRGETIIHRQSLIDVMMFPASFVCITEGLTEQWLLPTHYRVHEV